MFIASAAVVLTKPYHTWQRRKKRRCCCRSALHRGCFACLPCQIWLFCSPPLFYLSFADMPYKRQGKPISELAPCRLSSASVVKQVNYYPCIPHRFICLQFVSNPCNFVNVLFAALFKFRLLLGLFRIHCSFTPFILSCYSLLAQ